MAPTSPLLAESRALIDALGYLDTEYNSPEAQQEVQRLIQREMATFAPPKDKYLQYLPDYSPTFGGSARLQTEFKRVAANVPLNAIDMNRYQVKEPSGKQSKELQAWEHAVERLQVSLEHQSNRVENLELLQTYGTKRAKVQAAVVDGLKSQYELKLQETKSKSDKINLDRQQEQTRNAAKMQNYRRRYSELLAKNAAIKRACTQQEQRLQKKLKA